MKIITRKQAIELGLKKYFTGEPCRNGHVAEKYTCARRCVHCMADVYKNNLENILEKRKQRHVENRDEENKKAKEWRKNNPERDAENHRRWKLKNPDAVKASKNKWKDNNKDAVRSGTRNRRATKKNADGSHTKEDIAFLMQKQKHKCAVCKCCVKTKFHVDHIKPIARGGSNDRKNLQILCPPCNMKKGAKDPIDFMQGNGFLL